MSSTEGLVGTSTTKFLLLLLASSLSCLSIIHGQLVNLGYISIDCGYTSSPSYEDYTTGTIYVADDGFTNAGVTQSVNLMNMQPDVDPMYSTIRFFPNGTRNCYTLQYLKPGGKYYVRAGFGYGNYDTLNKLPMFDLYLGVNYWTTVSISNASTAYIYEVIAVSPANYLQVCLVNKGLGTPFISSLYLTLLQPNLYPNSTVTQSLVLLSFFRNNVSFGSNRYHFGNDSSHIRYPDDPYDRIWQKYEDVSTWTIHDDLIPPEFGGGGSFSSPKNGTYVVPDKVMHSVSIPANTSGSGRMDLWWSSDSSMTADADAKYFVVLYFAEVEFLSETKPDYGEFDVLLDNRTLVSSFVPDVMRTTVLTGTLQGSSHHVVSLVATSSSTRPPLISAMEVYLVRPVNESATYYTDGIYILELQF